MLSDHSRETTIGFTILALAAMLWFAAPGYFTRDNLTDLFLANLPVLIIALGMTLVILAGEIDISVGSVFAVCGVVAGTSAKWALPMPLVLAVSCIVGAAFGALNGYLVGYLRIPSIVVTLAMMIGTRDALRWVTQGAWVQDLPQNFQWLGLSQPSYPVAAACIGGSLAALLAWVLRYTSSGRTVYLTGSDADAARLAGVDTSLVKLAVFASTGALTGLAALLNSVRFNQIPANAGLGLEMRVIAAVVVGGTAITGGRGTVTGTLLGTVLIGAVGPALTFVGVTAYWERAIQGGIILMAVMLDATRQRGATHRHDVAATA
jgi:rhamnose transport system permease protein